MGETLRACGSEVRRQRRRKGWNQQNLADRAGVSKRTVENAEAEKPLQIATVRMLAESLGVAVGELVHPDDRHLLDGAGAIARGDAPRPPGGAADASAAVTVVVIINGDFRSFGDAEQDKFVGELVRRLGLTGPVKVVGRCEGSVRLTLELTPDDAEWLLRAAEVGLLAALGVVGVSAPAPPVSGPASPAGRVTATLDPETIETITGGWRLVRRLAAGAYGSVWEGEAPGGVRVALHEVPLPDRGEGELLALEAVKQLAHPSLLRMLAYWRAGDRLLVAMEWAEGSLRERMRECAMQGMRGVPKGELLGYFAEVAGALDYLHGQRVRHGAVNPDTIYLTGGHAKLAAPEWTRFGLPADLLASQHLLAEGEARYHALDHYLGQQPASDQYSLAVSYVEARCGHLPPAPRDWLSDVVSSGRAFGLDPLPEEERRVLLRALATNPDHRFGSAAEFVRALAAS
jgi:transcriptional regulator with XRE-family HTH domain